MKTKINPPKNESDFEDEEKQRKEESKKMKNAAIASTGAGIGVGIAVAGSGLADVIYNSESSDSEVEKLQDSLKTISDSGDTTTNREQIDDNSTQIHPTPSNSNNNVDNINIATIEPYSIEENSNENYVDMDDFITETEIIAESDYSETESTIDTIQSIEAINPNQDIHYAEEPIIDSTDSIDSGNIIAENDEIIEPFNSGITVQLADDTEIITDVDNSTEIQYAQSETQPFGSPFSVPFATDSDSIIEEPSNNALFSTNDDTNIEAIETIAANEQGVSDLQTPDISLTPAPAETSEITIEINEPTPSQSSDFIASIDPNDIETEDSQFNSVGVVTLNGSEVAAASFTDNAGNEYFMVDTNGDSIFNEITDANGRPIYELQDGLYVSDIENRLQTTPEYLSKTELDINHNIDGIQDDIIDV